MNLGSIFREIINPDVVLDFCTGDKTLTLKEDGKDSKIKKLKIGGVPEDAFAFTLDYQPTRESKWFQQLSCYVNKLNDQGINKGCDLVLLLPSDFKILILDLKSDRPKKEDTERQLLNSELFVKYLLLMSKSYYDRDIDSDQLSFKRRIAVTRLHPPKNPTHLSEKPKTFKEVSVFPNNYSEASVHLNALLR